MSGVSKRKFLYFKLYINNLSNPDRINLNVLTEITSLNSPERTGVYYVTGNNIGALPPGFSNYGILLCMRSPYSLHPTNSNSVYVQEYTDVYGNHAIRSFNNSAWTNWATTATKDDIPTRYGGTGIEIPIGKSCKISVTKDGLFAALLFVQGTTGSGFGTFMIQGYGVEGGPSRYRVNSLNTSGTQSGITCTVGNGAYFMVKNVTDNKVRMVFEEFFNDSTFTHSII